MELLHERLLNSKHRTVGGPILVSVCRCKPMLCMRRPKQIGIHGFRVYGLGYKSRKQENKKTRKQENKKTRKQENKKKNNEHKSVSITVSTNLKNK